MNNYYIIQEYKDDEFIPNSKLYQHLISRDNRSFVIKRNIVAKPKKNLKPTEHRKFLGVSILQTNK